MTITSIGISAVQLDGNFKTVPVHLYKLSFPDAADDDDPIRLTRFGANQLSFNNRSAVTDYGPFAVVSLRPLLNLETEFKGVRCIARPDRTLVLDAAISGQQDALQRLINQCLMQGARQHAWESKKDPAIPEVEAQFGLGHYVELIDRQPSDRIQAKNDYLDAYQTVTLMPTVLPTGDVLVGVSIKHKLVARDHITLDWVIQRRPGWLMHISTVRHRYAIREKTPATAQLKGIDKHLTAAALLSLPQGEISLFDYHRREGNIRDSEAEAVRHSQVVRVAYQDKGPERTHLAALLQPMFDFDTLRKIDSPLLNRIASRLKWPVGERLASSWGRLKGMKLGELDARLGPIRTQAVMPRSVKPDIRLRFGAGRHGASERDIHKHLAYQPMQVKRIVPIIMGDNATPTDVEMAHFQRVQQNCLQWTAPEARDRLRWVKPVVVKDHVELDVRLSRQPPEDTLLLIALNGERDKASLRDVAFRYGLPVQFMRLDHSRSTYSNLYYGNLTAGVFSKGGGIISALGDMPGQADLFIGLDMGGVRHRAPGTAFLFTREGNQLGWQLADVQPGERVEDTVLAELLERSIESYMRDSGGALPRGVVLHRDGRLYESVAVIRAFEKKHGIKIDALEVLKSGAPHLYRQCPNPAYGQTQDAPPRLYSNPELGDAVILEGLDEIILSTYGGQELGKMGERSTVRSLRLRKRYGPTPIETLAQQVILLSRIHGSSLYRHPRLPVTTHHADRFATLRQECNVDDLSRMSRLCPVYL